MRGARSREGSWDGFGENLRPRLRTEVSAGVRGVEERLMTVEGDESEGLEGKRGAVQVIGPWKVGEEVEVSGMLS
jgi:hypothetical protein|tara:strand:- start:192 stop:416 length:225 start_codon:yes stop_codon:yes gene_type:complete